MDEYTRAMRGNALAGPPSPAAQAGVGISGPTDYSLMMNQLGNERIQQALPHILKGALWGGMGAGFGAIPGLARSATAGARMIDGGLKNTAAISGVGAGIAELMSAIARAGQGINAKAIPSHAEARDAVGLQDPYSEYGGAALYTDDYLVE